MRLISEAFEKQRILHSCHSDPTSGHLGIKRTIKRIRERFTWKGLNTEVIQLVIMKSYKRMFLHDMRFLQVKCCEVCQRNSAKLAVGSTELHPIPVVTTWHHVSIDFVGPISPISTSGNRSVHRLSK